MSEKEKSQADSLRDHINEQLEKNYDYSSSSQITADIQLFCNKFKEKKYSVRTIRPAHGRILNECLKNKGINPQSIGREKRKPRFNTDLAAKITPKPVQGSPDSTPQEEPKKLMGKDGQPITAPEKNYEHFDEKGVSASINAFYIMIRVAYPELEALSDEEKDSLGKMWLPAFQKYLNDNWAYIGIPFMATMGMMLPKIAAARKKHIKNEETKEADKESQERKQMKKCEWCSKEFKTMDDLSYHKRNCIKKPSTEKLN